VRGEVCLVRADGATHLPTGWIGRLRHDGALELYGRADRVCRPHGRVLHPERVEAALRAHPEVTAAAVVPAGAETIAFVTAADRPGLADSVAAHAARLLPRAALPARVVRTDVLRPRPDGTPDTDVLLALAARQPADSQDDSDGLVGELRALWCELLGVQTAAADANFFALGGHSLLGAHLVRRVEEVTGTRLKLADLFDSPTPGSLARHLRALRDDA
jgi:hypothetical protein